MDPRSLAGGTAVSAQRYTDPHALARMAEGRCPECNAVPDVHLGGFPGARCSLREDGVLGRIAQYRADVKAAQQ